MKNYELEEVEYDNESVYFNIIPTDESIDTNGHGTHVAGIIAAQLQNSLNIKGIAPKVKLYAFKCSVGSGNNISLGKFSAALTYATEVLGCRVVNMSFGVAESNISRDVRDFIHADMRAAHQAGVILVSSAGNNGNATVNYPAGFDEVIGVGSVNSKNKRSSFSNKNATIAVVAPGGDALKASVVGSMREEIYSLGMNTTQIVGKHGTSQAAPHVTAAAALMLSVKPDLTPAAFNDLLARCSAKIHGAGYDATDGYGNGLLDVEAMFRALTENNSCYIAPPSDDSITLFNLTDAPITAEAVSAAFADSGLLSGCSSQSVTIGTQPIVLPYHAAEGDKRLFLWNRTTLAPLAASR